MQLDPIVPNQPHGGSGLVKKYIFACGKDYTKEEILRIPPNQRWVAEMKIMVLQALDLNIISQDELTSTLFLSQEEISSWRESLQKHGAQGLKVTQIQNLRQSA
jgi:biotin operon repressor